MSVAVIRYNAGNTQSVLFALTRLGADPVLTDDPAAIRASGKVIFPGVGGASTTMAHLRETGLGEVIRSLKQPVLGICLGMQLMCRYSEENNTECLGIFDDDIRRFPSSGKVPHVGWNSLQHPRTRLFSGIGENDFVYFVHSYYAVKSSNEIAGAEYLLPFSAALNKNNFYAVQFHPEKSGSAGEQILKNFIEL